MIIHSYIYDDANDEELLITAEVEFPCRGARDRYGAQMEPDDDGRIVIVSAFNPAGEEVALNPAETIRAIDATHEAMEGPQE